VLGTNKIFESSLKNASLQGGNEAGFPARRRDPLRGPMIFVWLFETASRQCNRMHQRSDLLLSFTSTQACFDANPPPVKANSAGAGQNLKSLVQPASLNHPMLCFFPHCQHWQILPSPTCLLRQMNILYGLELSQRQRQRQQCQVFRHQVRRSEKPQCLLWTQRMYGGLQTVANLRFSA
jgi:hypothetical protein